MRIVLDTSIVIAAVRSRHGASNRLLQLAFARTFQILATPALFLEYEEVLGREDQRRVHGLSRERTDAFLIGLAGIIEPVRIFYQWRPQLRDADDEMVLETALNGYADAILTHNVRDFLPAASRFDLRVLRPADVIRQAMR